MSKFISLYKSIKLEIPFLLRFRHDDIEPSSPVKKQRTEVKIPKSASQPLLFTKTKLLVHEFCYSQECTAVLLDDESHSRLKYPFAVLFSPNDGVYSMKSLCPNVLLDECTAASCPKSHRLPEPLELRERLTSLKDDDIKLVFKEIILPYKKLVQKYFCVITEIYAERRLKSELIKLINVCDSNNTHSFYAHIIDALVKAGMPYVQALVIILSYNQTNTPKSLYVLFNLILDKRNNNIMMFLNDLDKIIKANKKLHAVNIEKLLKLSVKKPSSGKLKNIVRAALKYADRQCIDQVDRKLLQQFTKLR